MAQTVSTETRHKVAHHVKQYRRINHELPSVSEVAEAMNISRKAARIALQALGWANQFAKNREQHQELAAEAARRRQQPARGHKLTIGDGELAAASRSAYTQERDGFRRVIPWQAGLPGYVRVESVGPAPEAPAAAKLLARRAMLAAQGLER